MRTLSCQVLATTLLAQRMLSAVGRMVEFMALASARAAWPRLSCGSGCGRAVCLRSAVLSLVLCLEAAGRCGLAAWSDARLRHAV